MVETGFSGPLAPTSALVLLSVVQGFANFARAHGATQPWLSQKAPGHDLHEDDEDDDNNDSDNNNGRLTGAGRLLH